jgi:hypothetical protein
MYSKFELFMLACVVALSLSLLNTTTILAQGPVVVTAHDNYVTKYYSNVIEIEVNTTQLEPAQTDVLVYLPVVIKAASGWNSQSSNTNQDLLSVSCSSASHCVAVGKAGTVLVTTDGSTWETKSSGTSQQLNGVSCASDSLCMAVGNGGTILTSNNGGNSWTVAKVGNNNYNDISCPVPNSCYGVGDGGQVVINGASAQLGHTPLYGIDCPEDDTCFLVGLGRTYYYIDGSPQLIGPNTGEFIHRGISCPLSTKCLFIGNRLDGNQKGMLHFINNGVTDVANPIEIDTTDELNDIICFNETTCYVVGSNGSILATSNGGSSWSSETTITDKALRRVSCPDSVNCFVVGDAGTILKR